MTSHCHSLSLITHSSYSWKNPAHPMHSHFARTQRRRFVAKTKAWPPCKGAGFQKEPLLKSGWVRTACEISAVSRNAYRYMYIRVNVRVCVHPFVLLESKHTSSPTWWHTTFWRIGRLFSKTLLWHRGNIQSHSNNHSIFDEQHRCAIFAEGLHHSPSPDFTR